MRALNQTAAEIFKKLIDIPPDEGGHKHKTYDFHNYWPECGGGTMAVHVEIIGHIKSYPVWSVAHYYKQNGDLMADPEMTFAVINSDKIVPLSFSQANMAIYEESIFEDESGDLKQLRELQHDHTSFANGWLRNIKEQQHL